MKIILIIAALALAGCHEDRSQEAPIEDLTNWPVPEPDLAMPSPEERAALEMLRMGYDRWVVSCAFDYGRKGRSRLEAEHKCRADFHLGAIK